MWNIKKKKLKKIYEMEIKEKFKKNKKKMKNGKDGKIHFKKGWKKSLKNFNWILNLIYSNPCKRQSEFGNFWENYFTLSLPFSFIGLTQKIWKFRYFY